MPAEGRLPVTQAPRIIGYNLAGSYPNNMAAKYATTPAIDCSGSTFLKLRFQRWLRVKQSDSAAIQVSTNGSIWATLLVHVERRFGHCLASRRVCVA